MADKTNKQAENVPGRFYVDRNCIAAKLCASVAAASFRMSEAGDHAYVYKQPENPEEEALNQEALRGCPVGAIGDDGA